MDAGKVLMHQSQTLSLKMDTIYETTAGIARGRLGGFFRRQLTGTKNDGTDANVEEKGENETGLDLRETQFTQAHRWRKLHTTTVARSQSG